MLLNNIAYPAFNGIGYKPLEAEANGTIICKTLWTEANVRLILTNTRLTTHTKANNAWFTPLGTEANACLSLQGES